MGYRKISDDMKECALRLWELGWDADDICGVLDISRASLYRWHALFSNFGNVVRPPSPLVGRKRLITRAAVEGMRALLHTHPDTYLDELVRWLGVHHDIVVSTATLHSCLKDVGLTRKRLQKLAVERDEGLRTEWRDMVEELFLGSGEELVFVDETSKNDHTDARRYGYTPAGTRAQFRDVFVRGDRYSLAAALTKDGYIATRAIPGSFDSEEFYSFIVEEVVSRSAIQPVCLSI